jgi:hypothetical protein
MEENKYFKSSFFQNIIWFIVDYLWSFLEHVKQVFLHLLHENDDHDNPEVAYPPLKIIQISHQFVDDFDQNIPSEPYHNPNQVDKPQEIKTNISLDPTPSKTQHRYRPLNYLTSSMIFLQSTMSTYLCLMEKWEPSQLKNTSKGLSIL